MKRKCIVCNRIINVYRKRYGRGLGRFRCFIHSDGGVLQDLKRKTWFCNECWEQMGFIGSDNIYK